MNHDLTRVTANIADTILDFVSARSEFTGAELHEYVSARCGGVAPDSPRRVLQSLKDAGRLSYQADKRSRYRVVWVGRGKAVARELF